MPMLTSDASSQCIPSNNGGGGGGGGSCSTATITSTATVTSTETDTYTETDTVTVSGGGATVTVTVTGSGTPTSTPTDTPTSTPTGLSCPNKAPFKLFGVSESGAEFGTGTYPGTLNKDYTFPATSSIDVRAHALRPCSQLTFWRASTLLA
jgi:endoglucanase